MGHNIPCVAIEESFRTGGKDGYDQRLIRSRQQHFGEAKLDDALVVADRALRTLVDEAAYVGEVYALAYNEALRANSRPPPHASRWYPCSCLSYRHPNASIKTGRCAQRDSSIILLRVLDHADLPNAQEARVRVDNAQRVSGEVDKTWDHRDVMDPTTHHLLSYAGVRCRVLGTYYISNLGEDGQTSYRLSFGSDISNYYPNCNRSPEILANWRS